MTGSIFRIALMTLIWTLLFFIALVMGVTQEVQGCEKDKEAVSVAESYLDRMAKREGFKNKSYDDGTGVITVGIGHAMGPRDVHKIRSQRVFAEVFGSDVVWKDVFSSKVKLTDGQVKSLALYDINDKLELAKRKIENFDDLMPGQQEAIVDAFFRGDIGPKTIALIEKERFKEASVEYLNHRQYKNAEKLGIPGIIPRMNHNAAGIRGDHDK